MDITARGIGLSSIRVASSNEFATVAERDAYFAEHPSELVEGTYITIAATGVMLKYVNGAWIDVTPMIKGDKGDRGDAFTYDDFTPTQLEGLVGPKGEDGADGAKGDKGDPFVYSDFTSEQLVGLTGPKGDIGPQGPKGDTGSKGDTGEQGLKGDKGDAGSNGSDGSNALINGVDTIVIEAGSNININQDTPGKLIISATDGSSREAVDSVNALTGAVQIVPGDNVTIETVDGKIKVSSQAGSGGGGEDGATFTPVPSVNENTLNLSWINDKGKINPEPVSVVAPKGDKGDKGDTGQEGQQGLKGDKGDTGDKGDPFIYDDFTPEQLEGLTGPQGVPGDKGNAGSNALINGVETITIEQGVGITIDQSVPGKLVISATGSGGGENGATFTPVPTVDGNTLNLSWTNNKELPNPEPVSVVAPKGDTGSKGDKGEQGLKGDPFIYDDFTPEQLAELKGEKGDTGEKGADGTNGTNGADATINGVSTINIVAGANVNITQEGDTLTVSATGGSGGGRIENVLWENADGVGDEGVTLVLETIPLLDAWENYDELHLVMLIYYTTVKTRPMVLVAYKETIAKTVEIAQDTTAISLSWGFSNSDDFMVITHHTTPSTLAMGFYKHKMFKITGIKYNANPADYNVEPYSVYALNQMGVIPADTEEERQQQLNELGVY